MSARPFARVLRRVLISRWSLPAVLGTYVAAIAAIPVSSASSAPTAVAATVAAVKSGTSCTPARLPTSGSP